MPQIKSKPIPSTTGESNGMVSPYNDSVRWAVYDLEKSNERLLSVLEGVESQLETLNNHLGILFEKISDLGNALAK